MHTADQSRTRILGEQCQQPNPRLQQVLAVELGVGDRHQALAVHRRHRAGQPSPATEVDVDVVRLGRRPAGVCRLGREQAGLSRISVAFAPTELPGRQGAAAPLGFQRRIGVMPRSMS